MSRSILELQENDKPSVGFRVIKEVILSEPLVNAGFRFFEITFTGAGTITFKHGLGYVPKDVLQSGISNGATAVWNSDLFTSTDLSVTVTAACTVRAFIGTYKENR